MHAKRKTEVLTLVFFEYIINVFHELLTMPPLAAWGLPKKSEYMNIVLYFELSRILNFKFLGLYMPSFTATLLNIDRSAQLHADIYGNITLFYNSRREDESFFLCASSNCLGDEEGIARLSKVSSPRYTGVPRAWRRSPGYQFYQ